MPSDEMQAYLTKYVLRGYNVPTYFKVQTYFKIILRGDLDKTLIMLTPVDLANVAIVGNRLNKHDVNSVACTQSCDTDIKFS